MHRRASRHPLRHPFPLLPFRPREGPEAHAPPGSPGARFPGAHVLLPSVPASAADRVTKARRSDGPSVRRHVDGECGRVLCRPRDDSHRRHSSCSPLVRGRSRRFTWAWDCRSPQARRYRSMRSLGLARPLQIAGSCRPGVHSSVLCRRSVRDVLQLPLSILTARSGQTLPAR